MDITITEWFTQYPALREGLTAFAVIFVDLCALAILLAAKRERNHSDRHWAKETHGLMLQSGEEYYPLGSAEILIGRHPAADIRLDDPEISRFHALLTFSNGQWHIEDVSSGNGIKVNGACMTKSRVLRNQDVIAIGKRRMRVVRGDGKDVRS